MGQDLGPGGMFGIGRFWHDPEALFWMVDDGDDFALGGADRPGASQEVESGVVVEASLEMKS